MVIPWENEFNTERELIEMATVVIWKDGSQQYVDWVHGETEVDKVQAIVDIEDEDRVTRFSSRGYAVVCIKTKRHLVEPEVDTHIRVVWQ
jgi:hypothetical protein